ncbi:MAG: 23S rRNA (guanosine(2251)-2'-O)-methyltransferase RlmB [Thermodesulfobacteriota bacterium]
MAIIYGVNPVKEALLARQGEIEKILVARETKGRTVSDIIRAAAKQGIPVQKVSNAELARAAGAEKHQGLAALLRGGFGYSGLEDILVKVRKGREAGRRSLVLVLDSIKDPGNLGSLIRTASCAGVEGVIIPRDRACPVTPVVEKASAGAVSHVAIARVTNLARAVRELKDEGFWAVAIEADGERDIYSADISGDLALIVGSESGGVRRLVREASDECLAIPISGNLGSLNAAQAGAIALFEARRQGRKG